MPAQPRKSSDHEATAENIRAIADAAKACALKLTWFAVGAEPSQMWEWARGVATLGKAPQPQPFIDRLRKIERDLNDFLQDILRLRTDAIIDCFRRGAAANRRGDGPQMGLVDAFGKRHNTAIEAATYGIEYCRNWIRMHSGIIEHAPIAGQGARCEGFMRELGEHKWWVDAKDLRELIEQERIWAEAAIRDRVKQESISISKKDRHTLKARDIIEELQRRQTGDDSDRRSIHAIVVTNHGVSWDTWKRSPVFADARAAASTLLGQRYSEAGRAQHISCDCVSCTDQFRSYPCVECGNHVEDRCPQCHREHCKPQ